MPDCKIDSVSTEIPELRFDHRNLNRHSADGRRRCNSFQCVWFMQLGSAAETDAIVAWWRKKYAKAAT